MVVVLYRKMMSPNVCVCVWEVSVVEISSIICLFLGKFVYLLLLLLLLLFFLIYFFVAFDSIGKYRIDIKVP